MKWTSAEHARQVAGLAFDFRYFPRRYVWAPSRNDWWSPPELENATWERQQGAWMDIHPAVIERYQARKEYGRRMHEERRARQQAAGQQPGAARGTAVQPDDVVQDAPVPDAAAAFWDEIVKHASALGLKDVRQDVLYGARVIRLPGADTKERMILLPESNVRPDGVRRVHHALRNAGVDALWLVLAPPPGMPARLPVTVGGPALAWAAVGPRGESEVLHADGRVEPTAALLMRWLHRSS